MASYTYYPIATGPWSSPSTWGSSNGGTTYPGALDVVNMNATYTVTLDANYTVAALTFSGTNSYLTFTTNCTLTISGALTFTGSASSGWINSSTSSVTFTCTYGSISNATTYRGFSLTGAGSALTLNGPTTFSGANYMAYCNGTLTGTGTLASSGTGAAFSTQGNISWTGACSTTGGGGLFNTNGNSTIYGNISHNSTAPALGTGGASNATIYGEIILVCR